MVSRMERRVDIDEEEHLKRYARLLVEVGVGLRPGQQLFVHGGVIHAVLARCVEAAAIEVGGGRVHISLTDPLQTAQLISTGNRDLIGWYHERQRRGYDEILRTGGGLLRLNGPEFPQFSRELHRSHAEELAFFERGRLKAFSRFREEGVNQRRCPWVSAVGITPVLAHQLFPRDADADAYAKTAEVVFRCTHAERQDALAFAAAHQRRLQARSQALDEQEITELRITGGGNDFRVGLSRQARWLGPGLTTASGQLFQSNVPCEEVYTTPDRRRTQGRLVASLPFRTTSGVLVKGLVLDFRDGRVVDFDACEGCDGFEEWLATDVGSRYLGEIGLVGDSSPVAQSGLFFDLGLLDENAWPHVALGQSYKAALDGGESMTLQELDETGFNASLVHTDIMFGSSQVSVVATTRRRGEVVVIERGSWAEPFAGG
jgi:aminopeptidase